MGSKNKIEQNHMNILELTPIKILGSEYRQDGQIDVLVPRFKNNFLQSFLYSNKFMPKNRCPYIKANLDEIGSAAWELMDGKRTVKEIANILEEKYQSEIHPPCPLTKGELENCEDNSPFVRGQGGCKKLNNSNNMLQRLAMFVQKMNANKFITFIEFMEK